jgi:hypothetical protein
MSDTTTAKADASSKAAESSDAPADPAAIEDQIVAARARLAHHVDALAEEANPASLAKKGIDGARSFFTHDDGSPRADRIAKTAGAVVGFVLLRSVIRRGS